MDVVGLAVFANEATGQLVDAGVEYPKAFVRLGEYAFQRFDLQLQRVQARHVDEVICVLLGRSVSLSRCPLLLLCWVCAAKVKVG